jgi:hypothetical protein
MRLFAKPVRIGPLLAKVRQLLTKKKRGRPARLLTSRTQVPTLWRWDPAAFRALLARQGKSGET